ncbi:MAG TPA: glycosyltransferase [Candidatus Paceibacterota bacterium]|nr:glycosyltransferase [Candidatus Paceibacterota bacterium]
MKVITLIPVKNEAWILPWTLKNFSDFSDVIIIADQQSTDATRAICAQFPKVKVIDNNNQGHSNMVRWLLLDEARKIPGEKLIVFLDADEPISPKAIEAMKAACTRKPLAFVADWVQLMNDGTVHRVDGVWRKSLKAFAFYDDDKVKFPQQVVINDHTARIPPITDSISISLPILHLHFMALERNKIKQVWYMCHELAAGIHPYRVNNKYAIAKFEKIETEPVPSEWLEGVTLPPHDAFNAPDIEREERIQELFKEKGIAFFEPLDIWNNMTLRAQFEKEVGRAPNPSLPPKWLVSLNDMKNYIRYKLLK